jgi:adenosylcobyric acid synthase
MFKRLIDEFGVESNRGAVVEGLGFIDDDIIFKREKIVRRSIYNIFGRVVDGFEIHHGVSRNYPLYFEDKNIKGTFIHGIFEDERFNIRKKRIIDGFIEQMRERVDMDLFLKSISI